jgi:hypothetical protein
MGGVAGNRTGYAIAKILVGNHVSLYLPAGIPDLPLNNIDRCLAIVPK